VIVATLSTSGIDLLLALAPKEDSAIMGAALGKCLGKDGARLDMAIDKGFAFFDKDKSGYIDGPEATAAAQKTLAVFGGMGKKVTPAQIDAAFSKVSGPDHKLDKNEFGNYIRTLVEKAGGPKTTHAPTGTHGTEAAPVGAAAGADRPATAVATA
jgi:hypothetical protein